jgi:hypothetical protein
VGRAEFGIIPTVTQGASSMNRLLLSVAAVGLVAGLSLGADLKSGLQAGDSVSPFNPLNVTGKAAGKKACQV